MKPESEQTSMTFPIDRGMPFAYRAWVKYPFEGMKVGDSFFIPAAPGAEAIRAQSKVSSAWRNRKKKEEAYRSVRPADGGVRVWRIK